MTTDLLPPPVSATDPAPTARHSAAPPPTKRSQRWLRGNPNQPRWARPSLLALLLGTAVLYLYNLGASGYANSYYAAAVQAGTQSWKAFFFGSFDSSNYITVDKPPASLWVMELSGRIFGFSSWSMLAPQAVEGVLAVALVYGAVWRVSGHTAGLVAGTVLALTPAAALMFRFNNPDAFLVLLLVAGAYCLVRAVQSGSTKWLLLVGACVGFGFLTKMGQSLLVVPAFALAYLIAGPPRLGKRVLQLLAAGAAVVLSAGWWIAAVMLTPAADRPYIGGSTDNNILNLAFGYNGFGRLFGGSGNGGGGSGAAQSASNAATAASNAAANTAPSIGGGTGGGGAGFSGASGLKRLFSSEMALEISWLLPAALIALVAGLLMTRRAPRTDLTRAALVMWGGWLLVTGLVFSYMQGTIHPYYTIALAPAIAGLIATTGVLVWRNRATAMAQVTGTLMLMSTGLWSYHLLNQTPDWFPVLRFVAIALAILSSVALIGTRFMSRTAIVATVAAATVALSGSGAYALATTSVAHTGSTPSVGTSASSGMGGSAGRGFGSGGPAGTAPTGTGPSESAPTGSAGSGTGSSANTDTALVALLKASDTKWAAAASSSMTAASLELSSGAAVMSVGGFNGSDDAITLAQFKALVASGQIHYLIADGNTDGGGAGGSSVWSDISSWVAANYTAMTVGSSTVYDLTAAK